MRKLWSAVALVLLLQDSPAAQNPAPPHRVQLWNGHDLTGWVAFFKEGAEKPTRFWEATSGVLHLDKTPAGYVRTEKSFSNYHLHVEWRWPGLVKSGTNNSGIFVMQRPPDTVWPYSVQVQVKTGCCGDLIAQGGLTFAPANASLTRKKMAPISEGPVGTWNSDDIYCRAASVEVFVNGVRQNFVDRLPITSGQIALQMEGCPVEFRNLWLENL